MSHLKFGDPESIAKVKNATEPVQKMRVAFGNSGVTQECGGCVHFIWITTGGGARCGIYSRTGSFDQWNYEWPGCGKWEEA